MEEEIVLHQHWEENNGEWEGDGWVYWGEGEYPDMDKYEQVEILDTDKHGHPTVAKYKLIKE